MIKTKDIERWYASNHYRKKADWICIDQIKVILEWKNAQEFGQLFFSEEFKPYAGFKESSRTEKVSQKWINAVTKKPSNSGCIAIVRRPHYPLSNLLSAKQVLVLDGIQDPGNLGTIIRSAVAFNAPVICLSKTCVDAFHPKCVAATSGAIGKAQLFLEQHWSGWIKQSEFPKYVLNPNGIQTLQRMTQPENYILICGSEGQGVQNKHLTSINTIPLSIPMSTHTESLNAAISVSITLGHFFTNP